MSPAQAHRLCGQDDPRAPTRAWLSISGHHWLAWSQPVEDEIALIHRRETDRAGASRLVADVLQLEELKQLGT